MTMNNMFNFLLPQEFIPDVIEKRYIKLLKAQRKLHNSVIDYINSNVLSITYPSINFPITSNEQIVKRKKIHWKTVGNIYDLFNKEFTLTFSNVDSNICYKIVQEALIYHYLDTSKAYDNNIIVELLDENRKNIFIEIYRNVIFTGISDTTLAFNNQAIQSQTFTVNFTCNYIDIEYPADNVNTIHQIIKPNKIINND